MRTGILFLASIVLLASTARAQEPSRYGIGTVERKADDVGLSADYYTRLKINVTRPDFPPDRKKSKKLIAAFLKAFGGKAADTRTITVTLRPSVAGTALPEQPLIGYVMNTDTGELSFLENNNITTPMFRLKPGESIHVDLDYRDVQASNVNLVGVGKSVSSLFPEVALLSPLSKPVFDRIATVAGEVFSQIGGGQVKSAYGDNLSTDRSGTKQLIIPIIFPTGETLSTITLDLQATPTLARTPIDVLDKAVTSEVQPSEEIGSIDLSTGTNQRTFASDLRALQTYQKLAGDKSAAAAADFCSAGKSLSAQFGLTSVDRSQLIYAAGRSAGLPDPGSDSGWFFSCFNSAEVQSLNRILLLTPATSQRQGTSTIPPPMLWALGCLMRKETWDECKEHAPDPAQPLLNFMADSVMVSIDSGFIDASLIGEPRSMPKEELISKLSKTASNFRCFGSGMFVLPTSSQMAYRLSGRVDRQKLVSLQITPAPGANQTCTSD